VKIAASPVREILKKAGTVSASNSRSPSVTCSPSVFSHAVSRSSSLVCVSAGMRMGVAIYATASLTAAVAALRPTSWRC
jgi:hypothetical protein